MAYSNQSVERAALILKTLSQHGALGVTEIARHVGLPKSITYRLLSSLKGADLVRAEPNRRRYMLGYGLLRIATKLLSGLEVRDVALPVLRQLRHETGETVALNVRDGDCRVTVERLDTSFEVRFVIDLGRLLPLHIGAAGKAILAFLPDEEIEEIIERAALSAKRIQLLSRDLAEIQDLGIADTCGERVAGSRSISAPILNHESVAIASVSILSLEFRVQGKKVNELRRLVKATAMEISSEMGWAGLSRVAAIEPKEMAR